VVNIYIADYLRLWIIRTIMKKILIINPNSSEEMTRDIQNFAKLYMGRQAMIHTEMTEGAPQFIETYRDEAQATPGMIRLIKNNQQTYDGFMVACHCDPNLDLMKEISKKPVVGMGESSMHTACLLGDRFTVVSATIGSTYNSIL